MRVSHALVSALLGSNLAVANPLHPRIYTKPPPAKLPRAETSENNNVNPGELIPGAYIVEFADDNDTPETFFNSLKADGLDVESRMDLSNRLFKGVSFQVKNAGEVHHDSALLRRKIESSPRIRSLWPVRTIQLAKPEDHGAPANGAITKANARRQEAAFGNSTKDTFSPHVMTQVDKLREQGITGKGVRIAIIDSGVDYTHPALGGCFGPGCLVEAGWDFTGDDFLPNVRPLQPDADPMDNCAGHGTHVAGIIAAQLEGNEYGFTGAAPGAKLAAYRAWGCASTSTNEVLLAAFSRAFEEGADIISCSDGEFVHRIHLRRSVHVLLISMIVLLVGRRMLGVSLLPASSTLVFQSSSPKVTTAVAACSTLQPRLRVVASREVVL